MKYLRKNILHSRNTHKKKLQTHEGTVTWWHETHVGTRPTEFSTIIFSYVKSEWMINENTVSCI